MNANHPIEGLMQTAMQSLKDMVDVNTIVGDPVETPGGSVIMPISKISLGFAAGGSEFSVQENANEDLPFGGGSGAGISVQPVAFLVVGEGSIRLLPVDTNPTVDRLIDVAPQIVNQVQGMLTKKGKDNAEAQQSAHTVTTGQQYTM